MKKSQIKLQAAPVPLADTVLAKGCEVQVFFLRRDGKLLLSRNAAVNHLTPPLMQADRELLVREMLELLEKSYHLDGLKLTRCFQLYEGFKDSLVLKNTVLWVVQVTTVRFSLVKLNELRLCWCNPETDRLRDPIVQLAKNQLCLSPRI